MERDELGGDFALDDMRFWDILVAAAFGGVGGRYYLGQVKARLLNVLKDPGEALDFRDDLQRRKERLEAAIRDNSPTESKFDFDSHHTQTMLYALIGEGKAAYAHALANPNRVRKHIRSLEGKTLIVDDLTWGVPEVTDFLVRFPERGAQCPVCGQICYAASAKLVARGEVHCDRCKGADGKKVVCVSKNYLLYEGEKLEEALAEALAAFQKTSVWKNLEEAPRDEVETQFNVIRQMISNLQAGDVKALRLGAEAVAHANWYLCVENQILRDFRYRKAVELVAEVYQAG
jgi:DNA repair exonuclease SbcCD ATPase subunit